MLLIFFLFILKTCALADLVFLYEITEGVSPQTHTFIRAPLFVTMVAYFGFLSVGFSASARKESLIANVLAISASRASRSAFILASSSSRYLLSFSMMFVRMSLVSSG